MSNKEWVIITFLGFIAIAAFTFGAGYFLIVSPQREYETKCRRLGGLVEHLYRAHNCRGPNNQLIDMDQP